MLERLSHYLVSRCDYLVQREVQATDVVVLPQILGLLRVVVRVIDLNSKHLLFFEMKINEYLFDELWI